MELSTTPATTPMKPLISTRAPTALAGNSGSATSSEMGLTGRSGAGRFILVLTGGVRRVRPSQEGFRPGGAKVNNAASAFQAEPGRSGSHGAFANHGRWDVALPAWGWVEGGKGGRVFFPFCC